jgi:Domain of unknown function (DUF4296)
MLKNGARTIRMGLKYTDAGVECQTDLACGKPNYYRLARGAMKKFLILLILLPSCSQEHRSVEILDSTRFMEVYVALATTDPTDSTQSRSDVASKVFADHGVTENQFRATVEYYTQHPESWKEILDAVIRQMEAQQAAAGAKVKKTD